MTPGSLNIPIYRGAGWRTTLILREKGTMTPLNLTGLGPFVCEIRDKDSYDRIFTATVTSDYDATGEIVLSLTAAQTRTLAKDNVRIGLRDALDNPYINGILPVIIFAGAEYPL